MKSLINFISCCQTGQKNANSENLPTVVIHDESDNKLVEKSTSKSNGSNKNCTSSELEIEMNLNKRNSKLNQGNLHNINFSQISDECEYSMGLLNDMNSLGGVNNTYPEKNRSSSSNRIDEVKQRINTLPKSSNQRTSSVPSKEINEFNLSQEGNMNKDKNIKESIGNSIKEKKNFLDEGELISNSFGKNVLNNQFEIKKEEDDINLAKNFSVRDLIKSNSNKFNQVENNLVTDNSINNKYLNSNGDLHKKNSDISFKNDRFNNPNMINIYTHTNESLTSMCSVNFNTNNIVILDSEINTNKKLLLEDVSGNLLHGKKLYIDAAGLKGGLRNKRDGFTFFGTAKYNNKAEILNDFVINYSKNNEQNLNENQPDNYDGNNNNSLKRSFVIFYDRIAQKYFFRNMNESILKEKSLIYIKIEKNYFIEKKKFFLMGHLLLNIDPDYVEKVMNITVFFKDSDISKKYSFNIDDSPISIGRSNSLTIPIDHSFLSKHQCFIEYDKIFKIWKIIDGSSGGKKSTHGTWLLVDSKYELMNSTFVKIGHCVFKINFSL